MSKERLWEGKPHPLAFICGPEGLVENHGLPWPSGEIDHGL